MTDDKRVLIVDDSAIVRRALADHLGRQPGVRVVATATDPYDARDKILELDPDAVILDIQMPRMNGLTFLKKLRKYHPVPTIVVSSLTTEGADLAVQCLEHGAIAALPKPDESCPIGELAIRLGKLIRGAGGVRVDRAPAAAPSAPARTPRVAADGPVDPRRVVVIGSSTGGTEALRQVLEPLGAATPGIAIAQHMPPGFTASFAKRLDSLCEIEVREARDRDRVEPGVAVIAPGDRHLRIARDADGFYARVADGPHVCHHKPSVEVLFRSAASSAKDRALGVILTGMGSDGAGGMLAMREAGARTVAQDEATCVVYGMPRAAVELGGVERQLPLGDVPAAIAAFARAELERRAA